MANFWISVILAQAGYPGLSRRQAFWIPACAGMTWFLAYVCAINAMDCFIKPRLS
jgi:hypothetical protein